MAYNTKSIVKDINNKPVPQYFNPGLDNYQVIESDTGFLHVMLVDQHGNEVVTQDIANQIENKLDQLIGAMTANGV